MKDRMDERDIPEPLARDTYRNGLITDRSGNKKLHVSDHLIVISSDDGAGLTTWRHALQGDWRVEDRADGYGAPVASVFKHAYFFSQVREYHNN